MRPILITGGRGQLGADLARALQVESPVVLDRTDLDVADAAAVGARIAELRPAIVLNTAAYNKVDLAEEETEAAWRTNGLAPRGLAAACDAVDALLVHFSTDYVFGTEPAERHPRSEREPPSPRGVYAVTKLAGELFALGARRSIVIRSSGLYGLHGRGGKGTNFIETMLRIGAERGTVRVVDDQALTPTATRDLAATVALLLARWRADPDPSLLGLYHVTNSGACTWCEFAGAIFAEAGLEVDVTPISTAAYGARAPRPAYSVLANEHLERVGLPSLVPWREALVGYLAERRTLDHVSQR